MRRTITQLSNWIILHSSSIFLTLPTLSLSLFLPTLPHFILSLSCAAVKACTIMLQQYKSALCVC